MYVQVQFISLTLCTTIHVSPLHTEAHLHTVLHLRTLGTPDDHAWPGVTLLPDYKSTFPKWPRQKLQIVVKMSDPFALDLLEVCVGGWVCEKEGDYL